ALRQALGDPEPAAARRAPAAAHHDHAFFYDEWDHLIGDYRSRWCRLTEVGLAGDAGEFFGQTLDDYARLLPEVRRQFQRIRPEMYRTSRGLEDGEDFDLNSTIDARIDVRARRAPSTRLYRSRVREAQAHRHGGACEAPDAAQRRFPAGRRLRRGPAEPRLRHPRHGGSPPRGRRGGHHALLRHRRPRRA